MKNPPSWLFALLAIPWPVLACLAWIDGRSLTQIVGSLAPLAVCVPWYLTLRSEERFEAQPHYQERRATILRALPVGSAPQLSFPELLWSEAREHFGVTKLGAGKFLRTTFWSDLAFGHFDHVDGKITAVSLSPNFGRWRRHAEIARRQVRENQKPKQSLQPTAASGRG